MADPQSLVTTAALLVLALAAAAAGLPSLPSVAQAPRHVHVSLAVPDASHGAAVHFASTAAPLVLGDATPCPAFHVLLSAPSRADAWLAMDEGDTAEGGDEDDAAAADVAVEEERACVASTLTDDVSTCQHTCALMNLTVDTMYSYAIVSPDGTHRFAGSMRTPAAVAEAEPQRFAITGDMGVSASSQAVVKLLERAHMSNPLQCVVLAGDVAYGADKWGDLEALIEPVASAVPWMTAQGNHDELPALTEHFPVVSSATGAVMAGQLFYSFDLGRVHVVVLSSEMSLAHGEPQEVWLEKDLRTARFYSQFVVVVIHHPTWSSSLGFKGESHRDSPLWTVGYMLSRYDVDLVVSADDHGYERTRPIPFSRTRRFASPEGDCPCCTRATACSAAESGTTHVVVGTGGAPFHGWKPDVPEWSVKRGDYHGALFLTADADIVRVDFEPVGTDHSRADAIDTFFLRIPKRKALSEDQPSTLAAIVVLCVLAPVVLYFGLSWVGVGQRAKHYALLPRAR